MQSPVLVHEQTLNTLLVFRSRKDKYGQGEIVCCGRMRTPRSSIQAVLVVGALVITSLLINPNRATAGTPVQGPISTDTSWTADESPYWVEGDVVVLSPANLTVEPGVEVLFNGLYAIYVEGVLYSVGTPASAIDYTSNLSTPSPGDWKGLQVNATGRATIRHTIITSLNPFLGPSS